MSFCPEKFGFNHKDVTGKACIYCGTSAWEKIDYLNELLSINIDIYLKLN